MREKQHLNRRQFISKSATLATVSILPRHVLGGARHISPSDQLNVAVIGTGGQGITNIKNLLPQKDVKITAICDPAEFWDNSDLYYKHNGGRGPAIKEIEKYYHQTGSKGYHGCKVYVDFRVMLEKSGKDIDAVVVATPNHVHAVASMAAIKAGKGVYCEKPLTHSVYESRKLAEAAREAKVATQLGNQGHSTDDIRRAVEWVRDGAIGKITKVYAWADENRILKYTERPEETPPVPKGLYWDLWLGPAKERPFHPVYAPLVWHYWWDFGGGRLGNFGCHTLDTAVWALNLEHPTFVESSSTQLSKDTTPLASMCHYKFPSRGTLPPVDLFWYDGGIRPPRPDFLELERSLPREGGSLLIGEHGAILSGTWSGSPRIIPEKKMRAYKLPEATIPRSLGHHRDWINACKGGPPASSNFDYGARLTEIVLLGVVSLRTGTALHWDGAQMKATNAPQTEPIIHGHFRKGWDI
ncbi:MAG: Gfo/Idh/MocA family oxidoreductase [Sedimentisphaerales bacterium]|nr:Gfo/Idh/MocA family oxidoreductase [Sedimentisphaerales bacterium]